MREYERIRDMNHAKEAARRDEIYSMLPEYRELDSSMGSIAVRQVMMALGEDVSGTDDVHSSLSQISARKKQLLQDAGYSTDYLDPIYTCTDCKDTGYIQSETGLKEKCHCFRNREIALLYDQSNIQDMISSENFTTLSYHYYANDDLERFKRTVDICKNFVQNFEQDYHNLIFYGTVGTGKSFLSGCVANELLKNGNSVIYFSAVGMFERLAQFTFHSEGKNELVSFYEDLYQCDLLIIDDLGTELTNQFVSSQLFSCLNERHLRKKSTIISTNLSLEEIRDRYSDRVFSRLTSNYQFCKLTGPDIRMLKKRNTNLSIS
ncbi:MAG: ATP-binding protein [Acetatifactor sp.]|nr:ATP-binding protein [Acetatifactor sp.]